jgi:hypothetical protein
MENPADMHASWQRIADGTRAAEALLSLTMPPLDCGEMISIAFSLLQTVIVKSADANPEPQKIEALRRAVRGGLAHLASVIEQPDAAAMHAAARARHDMEAFRYQRAPVLS